jgi:hypothetical protein
MCPRVVLRAKEKRKLFAHAGNRTPIRQSSSHYPLSYPNSLDYIPTLILKILLTEVSCGFPQVTPGKCSDGTSNWTTMASCNRLSEKTAHEWLTSIFISSCTLLHTLQKVGMRARTRPTV